MPLRAVNAEHALYIRYYVFNTNAASGSIAKPATRTVTGLLTFTAFELWSRRALGLIIDFGGHKKRRFLIVGLVSSDRHSWVRVNAHNK